MHFYIIKYFTVIIKEEPSKNSRILISLNLNDSSLSSWESSVENLTITVFRSRPDIMEYPENKNIKISPNIHLKSGVSALRHTGFIM